MIRDLLFAISWTLGELFRGRPLEPHEVFGRLYEPTPIGPQARATLSFAEAQSILFADIDRAKEVSYGA